MAGNDFNFEIELPKNYEQKTLCCFVLDVSGSMHGEPIWELNKALRQFYNEIFNDDVLRARLETSIITFSSEISVLFTPALVDHVVVPSLSVDGGTRLADAVYAAMDLVEARKQWYRIQGQPYLRPWIVLITDGAPDDDQDIEKLAKVVEGYAKQNSFVLFALGTEGADMKVLDSISHPMRAQMLQGAKFVEFFQWLNKSMSIIASSKEGDTVNLPDASHILSIKL